MGWFRSGAPKQREGSASVDDRLATIEPGVPGHCPACDGLGYIDNLDIGHRYQIQHCKDCGHRWEYLFDGDGHVVGLTELDELGQPVTRTRVRRPLATERVAAEPVAPATVVAPPVLPPVAPAPAPDGPAARMIDVGPDEVIDLRDPAPAPPAGSEAHEPDAMSPAEWLRHAVER